LRCGIASDQTHTTPVNAWTKPIGVASGEGEGRGGALRASFRFGNSNLRFVRDVHKMRSPNILPEELTRPVRNFCARRNVSLHRKNEAWGHGQLYPIIGCGVCSHLDQTIQNTMQCSIPSRRAFTASLLFALSALAVSSARALVVDFGDVPLGGPESFANGGPTTNNTGFVSGGVHFSNDYYQPWDSWYGFAASNTTDTTTPGFGNQYSAITGGGFGDANYGVAYSSAFGDPTVLAFATESAPESLRLTNTTYAALDMLTGNPTVSKKFGGVSGNDPDYFKVTLTGRNTANAVTGAVDFYLADYRFADNAFDYLINTWTLVDLTPLGGNVKTITFTFDSSDVGLYGINTPTYVAIDALAAIPEPSAFAVMLGGAGLLFANFRRRRACLKS
jgi:hypothetical protein